MSTDSRNDSVSLAVKLKQTFAALKGEDVDSTENQGKKINGENKDN